MFTERKLFIINNASSKTRLLNFFQVFLIIALYFLIPAVYAHIFNSTEELIIPTGAPTNKLKIEVEAHLLLAESKTRKCSK